MKKNFYTSVCIEPEKIMLKHYDCYPNEFSPIHIQNDNDKVFDHQLKKGVWTIFLQINRNL